LQFNPIVSFLAFPFIFNTEDTKKIRLSRVSGSKGGFGTRVKPCILKKPSHVPRIAWLVSPVYAAGLYRYLLASSGKGTSFPPDFRLRNMSY
jgi:hypothetical protein